MKNCHIQVPRSVIKNFCHKEIINKQRIDYVYYYDFKKCEIGSAPLKIYGTAQGYYREDIEALLDKRYESPFGNFKRKIYKFIQGPEKELTINKNDYNAAKEFLRCLLIRNESIIDFINKNSIAGSVEPITANEYINFMTMTKLEPVVDFNKYSLTLLVASENERFINNLSGFAILIYKNQLHPAYFVPICSKGGIYFFYPSDGEIYKDMLIANNIVVKEINKRILISEFTTGFNSLFAQEKSDLINCINNYTSHLKNDSDSREIQILNDLTLETP